MVEKSDEFIRRKELEFQKEKEKQIPKSIRDILDTGTHLFIREAWTFMQQQNYSEKVFVIERFNRISIEGIHENKQLKPGDKEYRFGYFIVGKKGRAENKWWWGQSCPLIPITDLDKLLTKAREEGTIEK